MTEQPPEYDDVILAYLRYAPPRPEPGPPIRFTPRQRLRIARHNAQCAIEQWIHDRLHNARCDT